jgi:ABC-2 type transport system permease protein
MTSAPPVEHLRSEEQPDPQEAPHRHRSGLTFTAWWALYLLTLRQHLHGKKWIVLAVLFLLPAGLAVFVRATSPDVPGIWLEFSFAYMFIPQALLPLVGLIYASGMIQDEQEEQTLTYLLMRPIPKWALYGVKLLATLTTTIVLTALFTAVTYAAIYIGGDKQEQDVVHRCLITIGIHSLAITAYCSLFGLMSLLTRRTLIVGILYAAIFEGLLANLPLSIRLITVIYYSRIIAYRTLTFVMSFPGGKQDLAAPVWHLDPTTMNEHPAIRDCILVLLLSSAAFTMIAAYLCRRREFHVKTPEKP